MKNYLIASVNVGKLIFHLLLMITLSFFLVSCEKEEMDLSSQDLNARAIIADNNNVAAAKSNAAPAPGEASIAAIAIGTEGEFEELVAALSYVDAELQTGLVDLFLNGTDQYTVFAPTDEAFNRLYDSMDEVDEITDLPAMLVLDVLLYHVTEGRRAANSVVPPRNYRIIETLLGESFTVDSYRGITAIGNKATITTPDISASNGIIHVIDEVLLPFE